MTQCAMCDTEIKASKPIVPFYNTLFNANGIWAEHLNLDNQWSSNWLKALLQDDEGEWLDSSGATSAAEGAECSGCKNKFDMGHIVSIGWKKTKKERWHKIVTSRNYCGHKCMTLDLDDKKSPVHTTLGKKPAKKRKAKKKN